MYYAFLSFCIKAFDFRLCQFEFVEKRNATCHFRYTSELNSCFMGIGVGNCTRWSSFSLPSLFLFLVFFLLQHLHHLLMPLLSCYYFSTIVLSSDQLEIIFPSDNINFIKEAQYKVIAIIYVISSSLSIEASMRIHQLKGMIHILTTIVKKIIKTISPLLLKFRD